jgi:hypothetical protein
MSESQVLFSIVNRQGTYGYEATYSQVSKFIDEPELYNVNMNTSSMLVIN